MLKGCPFGWVFAKLTILLHTRSPSEFFEWLQRSPTGCKEAQDPTVTLHFINLIWM